MALGNGAQVTVSSSPQHMVDFSISGKLMGIFGLFCTNPQQDICMGASEGLHYLFQILVLHRSK